MRPLYRPMALLASMVAPVMAQDPVQGWEGLDSSGLSIVYVLDDMDAETTGRLLRLDADSLTLLVNRTERRYEMTQVKRLQREGDSLKNGTIIGAVVGGGLSVIGLAAADCPDARSRCAGLKVGYGILGTALYAAVGAGIDALFTGRTTLYEAPAGSVFGVGASPAALRNQRSAPLLRLGFTW